MYNVRLDEYRGVTDRKTDRHLVTAYAMHMRRAVKTMNCFV